MEEVSKMDNGSFWMVMKEGEAQFEGLYEVLVYKQKVRQAGGDVYSPRIIDDVQLFCNSCAYQFTEFETWLQLLCHAVKQCPSDELAAERMMEIWSLCNDLQTMIQRKLWVPYDLVPPANNNKF